LVCKHHYPVASPQEALLVAQAAGAFLIAMAGVFAWRTLRAPKQSTLQLAMLVFILYVGGSALGTAGGRLLFGVDQALSSRYMTPALSAWAALVVLVVPSLQTYARRTVEFLLLLLLAALLPQQLMALEPKRDELFERDVAAMAIELGIKDQAQISHVFPSAEWALSVAQAPVERNLSVFGMPPLKGLRGRVGSNSGIAEIPADACTGHLDEVSEIKEDSGFLRLRGWIAPSRSAASPEILSVVDGDRNLLGFVYWGQPRVDVAQALGVGVLNSGFKGYLRAGSVGKPAYIIGSHTTCKLTAAFLPAPKD
jgi:hypothetical protein